MSTFNIGKIKAKNLVVGDNNNTVIYNNGSKSLELNEKEKEVIDELLKLMKSEEEQDLFLEDVGNYRVIENEDEKRSIGTKLLATVSKVVQFASATDTGLSLYDRFVDIFNVIGG